MNSEATSIPHIYERREKFLKEGSRWRLPKLEIKGAQIDSLNQISDLKNENIKYQSIIQMLIGKINIYKTELSLKEKLIKDQSKLINAYKIQNKMVAAKWNKTIKGFLKASKTAIEYEDEAIEDLNLQHSYSQQLEKENEILKKILSIQNEWNQLDVIDQQLKDEEQNAHKLIKTKSTPIGADVEIEEFNPFKGKYKMNKEDMKQTNSESVEKQLINIALEQKNKNTKRKRSESFYFGAPEEEANDEDFSSFDFNPQNKQVSFSETTNIGVEKREKRVRRRGVDSEN